MQIVKRNGKKEQFRFDKIQGRIEKQTFGLNSDFIDVHSLAIKIATGCYDGINSRELDNLAAETAASMSPKHPDYSILASRIAISSLHKETEKHFSDTIEKLHKYIEPKTNEPAGLISDEVHKIIMENKDQLNGAIINDRDFSFDYFGFKTLEKSYLLKINGKVAERPQHLLMRVSVGIWKENIAEAIKTYDLLSQKYMIHATPTLFNSGTVKPQMSSCFLLAMKEDSIRGIYDTLADVAAISQNAGGIGLHIHNIRATGSYIKGTNGTSNGLLPMLQVYNATARYVDQGGGKRKGSFAMYLEPWHADVLTLLEIRKNHGKEELRARDLFTALWIPDLFMERIEKDADWSLMCPNECKGLSDVVGEEFKTLYEKYEQEGKFKKVIKARELLAKIEESQIETGAPYMLYKDACNLKSNQKNLGTIKSSNLCTEIIEYSSKDEQAVCNLASIALPMYIESPYKRKPKKIDKSKLTFNFEKLFEVTYQATKNLNKVIDENFYPTEETKRSNMRHRPIGLGVQGLADVYAMMGIAFESEEAKKLNKEIFETIYFASMTASKDLAKEQGTYETYEGSPLSKGIFQFDMWTDRKVETIKLPDGSSKWDIIEETPVVHSGRWNWDELKEEVKKHGVRNSLLVAPMPTASTSQILGNNECFEPYTSNIYTRRVLSGEFVIINKHLVNDLIELGIWNENLKDRIILNNGSVQGISEIPTDIQEIYKTVWEIKQKNLIDMSADRGVYICQSQSFNIHIQDVNFAKLTNVHLYGWKKGLKTGMYYLRTKAAMGANKGLGIDESKVTYDTPAPVMISVEHIQSEMNCSLDDPSSCEACGS